MAYCTNAHVSAEFKDITFSASSSITSTEVDRFITESDAEIDGILAGRFEVPVTGPTSLLILRQVSILLTAARIQRILKVKTGDDKLAQDIQASNLRKQALAMLEKIMKSQIILTDATLVGGVGGADGVRSYGTDVGLEHTFRKGENQW